MHKNIVNAAAVAFARPMNNNLSIVYGEVFYLLCVLSLYADG